LSVLILRPEKIWKNSYAIIISVVIDLDVVCQGGDRGRGRGLYRERARFEEQGEISYPPDSY